MSEPFLGQIQAFAFGWPPYGWAECNGQLLSIQQNSALFALLGTTFGGNGTSNFALPDLRGRVSLHAGPGTGLTPRVFGSAGGAETATVSVPQMPAHTHSMAGSSKNADQPSPAGAVCASPQDSTPAPGLGYVKPPFGAQQVAMAPDAIAATGGGQGHDNMQPWLCLYYCIATAGVFPSRQ
jgi:microcystin-dependent protein